MVTRIDGRTLTTLLGWPEELADRLPPALWLPADHDDEPAMIAELASRWSAYEWGGLGTWFARASGSAGGFSSRYGDLFRHTVAEGSFTTPRGLTARSEWAVLDPRSSRLHDFMTDVRLARGVGSCLVIMKPDAGARAWYAPSIALVQRAMTAFERPPGLDAATTDRATTLAFVSAPASAGFATLVPLDLHPWGGYAVLADESFLSALGDSLPDPLPGLADASPEEVVARAGGLAF